MKHRHVLVPAVVEEAGRVAVIEILLLRAPGRHPRLDHFFLGGDVESDPELDPLHGVEFIAKTAEMTFRAPGLAPQLRSAVRPAATNRSARSRGCP
jgi:hypothetical protein